MVKSKDRWFLWLVPVVLIVLVSVFWFSGLFGMAGLSDGGRVVYFDSWGGVYGWNLDFVGRGEYSFSELSLVFVPKGYEVKEFGCVSTQSVDWYSACRLAGFKDVDDYYTDVCHDTVGFQTGGCFKYSVLSPSLSGVSVLGQSVVVNMVDGVWVTEDLSDSVNSYCVGMPDSCLISASVSGVGAVEMSASYVLVKDDVVVVEIPVPVGDNGTVSPPKNETTPPLPPPDLVVEPGVSVPLLFWYVLGGVIVLFGVVFLFTKKGKKRR